MTHKELEKMKRHERYLKKKEIENGVRYFGTEDELYGMNPIGIIDTEKELHETHYKETLRKAMYLALYDLRNINPYWYHLVCDFYFCNEKITLEELGEMYGKSRQAVTKTLKRAMNVIRELAEDYLEKLLD